MSRAIRAVLLRNCHSFIWTAATRVLGGFLLRIFRKEGVAGSTELGKKSEGPVDAFPSETPLMHAICAELALRSGL